MDSLKAHILSTRSTSIHNITNANTIVNKYYWYWLRLGDGEGKGEERREDLNRILPLFLEKKSYYQQRTKNNI